MKTYCLKVSVFCESRTFRRSTPWDGAIVHAIQMGFIGEMAQKQIDNLIEGGMLDESIERAAFEHFCFVGECEIKTKFWEIEGE